MSLCINTTTPGGIVLAADSRQSYRNRKAMGRVGSDSASKIFKLNSRIGIATAGLAFLSEQGVRKSISKFIDEFTDGIDIDKLTVAEVAKELREFFESKYQYREKLNALPKRIQADLERQGCKIVGPIKKEKDKVRFEFIDRDGKKGQGMAGVDSLQFIVAGYNLNNSYQVHMIYIPGPSQVRRDSLEKKKEYGTSWIGQTDVVQRIVLGFDGRLGNLPFIRKASSELGDDVVRGQLKSLEYAISWGTMTLQDAIDFSILAIETTTAIQRFSDGIIGDPGDIPGVGGHVDVALITPDKGFVWISKKNLSVNGKEVNLDEFPDLVKEKSKPSRKRKPRKR